MTNAPIASTPDEPGGEAVDLVLAMVRAAPPETRRQVHRLLAAEIANPPSAREVRVAELSFLKSLLPASPTPGCEFTTCERTHYDEVRPEAAPTSRQLVDRYGSWSRACRAAYSLDLVAGDVRTPGKPWSTTNRDKPHVEFTRDELLAAMRQCAEELRAAGLVGRTTSWQYDEWVRRKKLEAKKYGQELRLPYAKAIYLALRDTPRGTSRWLATLDLAGVE